MYGMPATNAFAFPGGLLSAAQRSAALLSADAYLEGILSREAVSTGLLSPVQYAYGLLQPAITTWSNGYVLTVQPSGSFAKGTANKSGTDVDFFLSIRADVPNTVKEAYEYLANQLRFRGFSPRLQNVSIGISLDGIEVDLVPARQRTLFGDDHTIFHRKSDSWRKTNILQHVDFVRSSLRHREIRVLKLWRDQRGLEFPSFYLELAVIRALEGAGTSLFGNVATSVHYLAHTFASARLVDPANTANVISDDLTAAQKLRIQTEARRALSGNWLSFIS
jgi:hypothetical protein